MSVSENPCADLNEQFFQQSNILLISIQKYYTNSLPAMYVITEKFGRQNENADVGQ